MRKNSDKWRKKAAKTWPILVRAAAKKRTLTYKEVGEKIDVHYRAMRYVLELIQDYCHKNGLPIMACIVVRADTQKPGVGSNASGPNVAAWHSKVFAHNWTKENNPFIAK